MTIRFQFLKLYVDFLDLAECVLNGSSPSSDESGRFEIRSDISPLRDRSLKNDTTNSISALRSVESMDEPAQLFKGALDCPPPL
jgi:hypothetical protein